MENKFGTYDIAAYILPGSMIVIAIFLVINHHICTTLNHKDLSGSLVALIIFSLVGISFLAGQFTALIVSILTNTELFRYRPKASKLINSPIFLYNFKSSEYQTCLISKVESLLFNKIGLSIDLEDTHKHKEVCPELQSLIKHIIVKEVLNENREFKRHMINRSFCGNSSIGALVLSMSGFYIYFPTLGGGMLILSIALFFRHKLMNKRIWKFVYREILTSDCKGE